MNSKPAKAKAKKKEISGAAAVLEGLKRNGVQKIFGYPGGASIPIFDALLDSDLDFILCRHEQGGTHMADGYARATGKAGVMLVTSGPGATNTITGILTAQMDSVPMVVISGQTISDNLGLDAFQEANVFGITMPVVKHSYLVTDASTIPGIVDQAFHLAESGRPGVVLIDIPKDISVQTFSEPSSEDFELPGYDIKAKPERVKVEQAAEYIKKAKRPVVLVGHGTLLSQANVELRKLIEITRMPVVNTLLAKGAFPEKHSLSLGMLGMHGTAYANKAVLNCDLIMSLGSRWDDRIVGKVSEFCPDAVTIHVDIDPTEMGKMIQPTLPVVSDVKEFLKELNSVVEAGDTEDWREQIKDWKEKFPLSFQKEGGLKAQHVIDELFKQTDGKAMITTDVGQHQMWAAQFYKVDYPDYFLSSGGAGTMGFGFPAALGAQIAKPDRTVVAIVGDGGFQMTSEELSTAVINKLPVKILIIDNCYLGMVRQWQELFYDDRKSGVDMTGNPDFVKLGEAYGVKGFVLDNPDNVESVMEEALAYNEGPCIIHAKVLKTDNVFPMIPSGAGYKDMVIDTPQKKLEKPTGST